LRELRLDAETWVAWLHLNTLLVNTLTRPWLPRLPVPGATDDIDRRLLWRHGIGGERPILLLWIGSAEGLDLARQLVSLLALWTAAGQTLDLVVVNTEAASYEAPVQRAFVALSEQAALRLDAQLPPERRCELRLLNARELTAAEQATLRHLARVSLLADGRSLTQQLDRLRALHEADRSERRRAHSDDATAVVIWTPWPRPACRRCWRPKHRRQWCRPGHAPCPCRPPLRRPARSDRSARRSRTLVSCRCRAAHGVATLQPLSRRTSSWASTFWPGCWACRPSCW